jgi:hypothetical protein
MSSKPSQQQPAEGEKLKIQNPKDYAIKLGQKEVPSYGPPTAISPTEEELEREAEEYARQFIPDVVTGSAQYNRIVQTYLTAAKRYTRQGGEEWEALYISEHLNLLAAKGRIAQLEQQLQGGEK